MSKDTETMKHNIFFGLILNGISFYIFKRLKMTEETYNYLTSQAMLRFQFRSKRIIKSPQYSKPLKKGDFSNRSKGK